MNAAERALRGGGDDVLYYGDVMLQSSDYGSLLHGVEMGWYNLHIFDPISIPILCCILICLINFVILTQVIRYFLVTIS